MILLLDGANGRIEEEEEEGETPPGVLFGFQRIDLPRKEGRREGGTWKKKQFVHCKIA